MKTIPVQGLTAYIDDADFPLISEITWHASRSRCGNIYARAKYRSRSVSMHRLIMADKSARLIDHIDGNALNNVRSNLRLCSAHENSANMKRHRDNRSGFKGVAMHRKTGRWRAEICSNGRRISLGLYGAAEEAAKAYNRAAIRLFGEFARINFVK